MSLNGGYSSGQKEFEKKINSYGSFPVTRPSTLPIEEEETKEGCLSSLYTKLMGRPQRGEQGSEKDDWQQQQQEQQSDPPATWQEHCMRWLRVDQWTYEEQLVAGCVLALLFFSTGERIFFKAAVDDMAPFRYSSVHR